MTPNDAEASRLAATAAPKQGFHIPTLDGLRAVSFMIVFVAHAGFDHIVPGGFGVTVFFFLSGFLITTLMRMEFKKSQTVSFKGFYLRRVLRILPPFYVVLAVATVLAAVGVIDATGGLEVSAVAAQFLHVANYWIIANGYDHQALGTGVYWSLAVEEHFYFLFPVLFLFLNKRGLSAKAQAGVFLGLCAAILAWRCWLVLGAHAPTDRTYLGSDTRFDSILFGAALAVFGNPMLDGKPTGSEKLWKFVLLPLGVGALLFALLYRDPNFRETARYTIQGLGLIPIFVVGISWPEFLPFRPLNTKVAAFLGVLSYSLYLTHHVIIFGLQKHLPTAGPAVILPVAFAIALALAYGIHRFVEKPAGGFRKKLGI